MFPPTDRRFLVAVGLFGAGDFAHTLLFSWPPKTWPRARPNQSHQRRRRSLRAAQSLLCRICFRRRLAGRSCPQEPRARHRLRTGGGHGDCLIALPASISMLALCSSSWYYVGIRKRRWKIGCARNWWTMHTTEWRLACLGQSMVLAIFSGAIMACSGPCRDNGSLWL